VVNPGAVARFEIEELTGIAGLPMDFDFDGTRSVTPAAAPFSPGKFTTVGLATIPGTEAIPIGIAIAAVGEPEAS
jgi:hypothetical protein